MSLRPYQQDAFDAVMTSLRKSTAPIVVEAPTGAGKSHIIAAVASKLTKISGGKSVLCVAPSAELVEQNHEKFVENTGQKASFFSASLGEKSIAESVVFGTPVSINNSIDEFGAKFCAIVIDECHRITPTIKNIISKIKEKNSNVRVVGLSATPFRLGDGYIYQQDETGRAHDEKTARAPYFTHRVYKISAQYLIDSGYLTPPTIGQVSDAYETSNLTVRALGKFDAAEIDRAFVGHGRKTAQIVADVVAAAKHRRGVMFFGATIAHANEIMASLPPELSAIITGKTKKKERAEIIKSFKNQEIKYLVNVDVLTTGFDASHVDVIALLRATESASLLQQIVGRGLRLHPGKEDCLILDFAGNIERHCPDGDIFSPEIKASTSEPGERLEITCPDCDAVNDFAARPDCEGFEITKDGYLIDLAGNLITTEHGPTPAHLGRRCNGLVRIDSGEFVRCAYRWTSRPCFECNAPNDIAARYCTECKGEIIDPNEKLARAFAAFKKDPKKTQCDRVIRWAVASTISQSGNPCKRVFVETPHREFTLWFVDESGHDFIQAKYDAIEEATNGFTTTPETITYKKQRNSDFYTLLNINQPEDKL